MGPTKGAKKIGEVDEGNVPLIVSGAKKGNLKVAISI